MTQPDPIVGAGEPARFWTPAAIPASTVVIVRDSSITNGVDGRIEVLMLKRHADLAFAGGMWVFPGGRIDPSDVAGDRSGFEGGVEAGRIPGESLELAAIRAAIRETIEESGLVVEAQDLYRWSHWTAPVEAPKRFTTAFFVAPASVGHKGVRIDDGEIRDFAWMTPEDTLAAHGVGTLGLAPPTYITLTQLCGFDSVDSLLNTREQRPIEHFATRFGFLDDVAVAMYHGDAGYEASDPMAHGIRHRLTMGTKWTYERHG